MPTRAPTVAIAYFFFALPEPLRLPNGYVVESTSAPALDDVRQAMEAEHATTTDLLQPRTVASARIWQMRVPLQVVFDYEEAGVFDAIEHAFPPMPDREQPSRNVSGDLPRTVLEVAVAMDPQSSDGASDAFDRALGAVQSLQRAYVLATRESLTLLTQENAPHLLPMAVRQVAPSDDRWPEGLSLFMPNLNLHSRVLGEPLSEQEASALAAVFEGRVHSSFAAYAELKWEARSALYLRGDYRAAVMLSHSASETLFNALLMHMLWDETRDPEDAANHFFAGQGLPERLRRHYHERLGGNWSLTGASELGRWTRELAAIRHQVVHDAYRPTRSEGYAADRCLTTVDEFLVTRLTTPRALARYPRTAMGLLGRAGLERRGAWIPRLDELVGNPEEPVWIPTFERWRWVVRDASRDSDDTPEGSTDAVAALLLFRHDAPPQWYEHDRRRRRVRATEPPTDLPPAAVATMRASEEEFLAETHPGMRGTVFWPGPPGRPVGAPWVREHTVLPLHGVMLDGSDYRD